MRKVRVASADGALICVAEVAEGHWTRFQGLLGRKGLPEGQGLWIRPCSSVHMFFMRFPIDVVYLTKTNVVAKTCSCLQPFRLSFGGPGAHTVLELSSGAVNRVRLEAGQQLVIQPLEEEAGRASDNAPREGARSPSNEEVDR